MLLAQMQAASPEQLSNWLVGGAAILGIAVMILTGANQIKQLRAVPARTKRSRDDRYVTRHELEKCEKAILDKLAEHEKYTHGRLHELTDVVHALNIKVAAQPGQMRDMIDATITPLARKIDAIIRTTVAIGVKVGIPVDTDEN